MEQEVVMETIITIAITTIVSLGILTAVSVVRYRIELEKYRKAMENATPRENAPLS